MWGYIAADSSDSIDVNQIQYCDSLDVEIAKWRRLFCRRLHDVFHQLSWLPHQPAGGVIGTRFIRSISLEIRTVLQSKNSINRLSRNRFKLWTLRLTGLLLRVCTTRSTINSIVELDTKSDIKKYVPGTGIQCPYSATSASPYPCLLYTSPSPRD